MRETRWVSGLWLGLLFVAAALVLIPGEHGNSGLRLAGWLGGYPGEVAEQFYGLVKTAMFWVVAGAQFTLVWPPQRVRQASVVLVPLCLVVGAIALPAMGWNEVREVLYVVPGLALGIWLAERTLDSPGFTRRPGAAAIPSPTATVPSRGKRPRPETTSSGEKSAAVTPLPASSALRVASICLLGAGALSLVNFPLGRWVLGLGFVAYVGFLYWRPNAWLIVVPAALPLLDLAHWSGRFFWDEFDLLMLATLAVALWHDRIRPSAWQVPKLRGLLAAFLVVTSVSLFVGLLPLQALDANAFSAYWSHYNSLRVAKGLLWGVVCFVLYRSLDDRDKAFLQLAAGMAVGVLGVSIWALWEQVLFAGASTTLDYRVTASFSSMHTGGGHFETYLVIALPFLWGGFFLSRNVLYRAAMAAIFLLGAYALLSTVARGGAIALAVALLVLVAGTWRALSRHGAGWVRLAIPLALAGLTVALVAVGISGGFWKQRIGQTVDDAGIRWHHWSEVLAARDSGIGTALFGQGLGTLPATMLASRLPTEAGSYRYASEGGNAYLALNSAGTLYMAQRVPPRPGQMLTLEIRARAPVGAAGLEASLCERNLFNSRQCQWLKFDVKPGETAWQSFSRRFDSGEVGAGTLLTQRPVQFSLYNPVPGTLIEVDTIRLLDGNGEDLLRNGDFSQGGDFWLFKSGDHLFWHAKNLWVHLVFEQGWAGLGLFVLLALLALVRLLRPVLHGALEPTAWLAALAGLMTVGVVESVFDAPRLGQLMFFVLLVGAAWGGTLKPQRQASQRSRRRSRRSVHPAENPVV